MSKPLILAIVGHTNVGKTSLLRTLTHDAHFGEVSDRPSTTRHVEGARLSVNGNSLVELYDTPGLEDAISLRDYLDALARPEERLDGPARLERFLTGPEAKGRFEQEAKVIRQLFNSDAGLYIIDVREPVLPKYHDELAVLSGCGKPLLPVFNFVASEHTREEEWRTSLSRLGLHASVRFDTVSPPEDGEKRLYESLSLLIASAQQPLNHLIIDLESKRAARKQSAAKIIADVLIDSAAYSRFISTDEDRKAAIESLRADLRKHEYKAVETLLALYKFDKSDASSVDFPLFDGRFEDDLFSSEALKQMGVRLGMGFATGAAAGAGIDLAVGGLTMGAATTVGAIIGGVSQSWKHYGSQLIGKFKGGYKLSVDDAILSLLALRLQKLQQALDARGHAAQSTLLLENPHEETWKKGKIPKPLQTARAHPEWSSLNKRNKLHDAQRSDEVEALTKYLMSDNAAQ